ncbi:MAG: nitronate monooxygenase [Burkholderiaceae bacterium]|jgi:NAD(P)H-dependent flavin oxidoreductase YrpB (nitropropane dioxygenase family)|nr:nitronate monooxygenase [Burkholderiaceae bacterium]
MSTTPSIATRFTQRYGVRHPFACAGMAFAGMTPDLAIAVCRAGGIGALGVGFTPPELLRQYIRTIRAATDAPFNINFITCFDNDAQVKVCAEERVPIVSWHWGHPSEANRTLLREAGVAFWEQVGSEDDARRAVEAGAEVVIAQGYEAGGHNYQGLADKPGLPTFVLLPTIVDAVGQRAMVLGAGGIADGRGVAAALALGADAVWVGTRMVATNESAVHDEHKRRIVAARGEDTVFSSIFGPEWPHFNPMRLQKNRVVAEWNHRLAEVPKERGGLPEVGRTVLYGQPMPMNKFNVILPTPETQADWEEMPWLMGQGVGLVRDVRPAGEVVEEMMRDAVAIFGRLGHATA